MSHTKSAVEISIIIPTYNRANTLSRTLASILGQTDLESVEIIVVDNGSTDNTAQLCENFKKKTSALQYFYDAEPGLLTGRHLGASVAHGEILCFLDDDVELDSNWVSGVKDAFKNPVVQLATGPSIAKYEREPPKWLNSFWLNLKNEVKVCPSLSLIDFGYKERFIDPNYVWGLNFCIRKNALKILRGFHPDNIPARLQQYQGDGETGLTNKAARNNYKALYHPQIMLEHYISSDRMTVDYFKKRAFYQGVCNSFSSIRNIYLQEQHQELPKGIYRKIEITLQEGLHRVRLFKIKVHHSFFVPKEIKAMQDLFGVSEKEGFEFHQEAFRNDANVRKWVLKTDYWDYKLPTS